MSDTQTLMQRCSSMVPDKYATILLAASGYAGANDHISWQFHATAIIHLGGVCHGALSR